MISRVPARVHSSGVNLLRLASSASVFAGVMLSVFFATAAAQPAPGSRALIGDWMGTWKSASGSSGYLSITIDALDGDQARGSLFMAVVAPDAWGYYNRSVAFRGFFDGTALRITVPPALWFELTVSGRALRGTVQGQQTFGTVELERK